MALDFDFALKKYYQLLTALYDAGYVAVLRFDSEASYRQVLLRHDVDLRPEYALRIATLEAEFGMKAIYYFRAVPESWNPQVISQISALGHEIGYHYESLTTSQGNMEEGYNDFCANLHRMSHFLGKPIATICMHGSPRSPYDSRNLWQQYDYHSLGIDYEPYLDTDFSSVFYLTDTGRRWDGYRVSVRDTVAEQQQWIAQGLTFHTTNDIIRSLHQPDSMMIKRASRLLLTTHPQRWMPMGLGWCGELMFQNIKNVVKYHIINRK